MTVNANAYFGEFLYHSGDTDTNIRFETDQITLAAEGGASGTGNHLTLGNDGTMYFSASQDMRWHTGGTSEKMRLNSSGNLGIGTTNPGVAKLNVFSTTAGGPFLYVGDGTPNNDGNWDANIMLDSNAHSRLRIENRGDNKNLEIYSHTGNNPVIRAVDSATGLRIGAVSYTHQTLPTICSV